MYRKVRIKKAPQARTGYQVQGSLVNDVPAMGGKDYNAYIGKPQLALSKYITAVPREEANLEAEGGETVYGDINGDGMAEHKIIKGPRHSNGGVPLNLPDDTFIFSDTRSMRVKKPEILKMFGKGGGSYTPAELAKQYDVEKYRKILQDPNSDIIDRKTAELMIKNYTMKLGALALAQEAAKGFPQGVPVVAQPYMEAHGLTIEDFIPREISNTVESLEAQGASEEANEVETEQSENQMAAQQLNQGQPVAAPMSEQEAMMQQQGMPQEGMMRFGGPMAAYGMTMGGYDMPFAQDGIETGGWSSEPNKKMSYTRDIVEAKRRGYRDEPWFNMGLSDDPSNPNSGLRNYYDSFDAEGNYITPRAKQKTMAYGGIPSAEYGMPMGSGMSQNYQGRGRRMLGSAPMFARGGNLPKAQDGIEVDVTGMDAAAKDRALYNARKNNPGKEINVIENGKSLGTLKYERSAPTETGKLDMNQWGTTSQAKAAAAQYALLEEQLNDSKVLDKLYEETTNALKDKKSYLSKHGVQGKTWEERGMALPTKEQVKQQYLNHQKRNLMFQAKSIDPRLFTDSGQGLAPAEDILKLGALNPKTGEPIKTLDEAKEVKEYMRTTYGGQKKDSSGKVIDLSVGEVSNKIGVPLDASGNDRALQQATFHGYSKMIQNLGTYDADTQYQLRNFVPENVQAGVGDETSMGGLFNNKGVQVSPIDDFRAPEQSFYGNTTLGHLGLAGVDKYSYEPIDAAKCQCDDPNAAGYQAKDASGNCPCDKKAAVQDKCPCEQSDGTVIDTGVDPNTGECNPCTEDVPYDVEKPAPWWLQDTIKTAGAFGDLMGIKKYMPWSPGVDLETPRPTFLDPTRELAANAEQANITNAALAQFAGPQALSARASSVQGTAAKNAADILSRYNNANVNLANQFETNIVNTRNQEAMLRQAAASKLYDQNTIANQQFDNSKLAMKNQLRNYYTNAITNRWQTDALNQMYPNYAVDPSVGGQMAFTGADQGFKPESSAGQTYFGIREQCKQELGAGATNQELENCAKNAAAAAGTMASGSGGEYQDRVNAVNTMYPQQPKGQKGGSVPGFVYADTITPFLL